MLALYPLAMALTLVYTAEHFVIDILVGWMYVTAVFVIGNRVFDIYVARNTGPRRPRSTRPDAVVRV